MFPNYLNNKHEHIKFTVEKENNNSLAFFDILITKYENNSVHQCL